MNGAEHLEAEMPKLIPAIVEFVAVVNRLAVTARFMERPVFMAQLCAAVKSGVIQHNSPWLDPQAAAEYSFSSEGFVYQMAEAGVIARYVGEGMPRFKKSDIDEAIAGGRWATNRAKGSRLNAKVRREVLA